MYLKEKGHRNVEGKVPSQSKPPSGFITIRFTSQLLVCCDLVTSDPERRPLNPAPLRVNEGFSPAPCSQPAAQGPDEAPEECF